jgi:hypothetical protein
MACKPEPHRRLTLKAGVHVFGFGVDHVAKHHMSDVLAFDMGAGQGFAHDQGGKLRGGDVFEATAIGANGGAHTADDDDFTHKRSPELG